MPKIRHNADCINLRELSELLIRAGLTKTELAKAIGVKRNTIYQWYRAPNYARAYLELRIKYQRIQELL